MRRAVVRYGLPMLLTLVWIGWPSSADAQRRRPPSRRGAVVFVGGYFYDPFFGPYPWWTPGLYPWRYHPVFDDRAEVRVKVEPKEAAVYVDGYYAGIVDDFDGAFQRLPLSPGAHDIDIYLEGYRTAHQHIYVGPGSSYTVRDRLERLGPGETSAPPAVAPELPPPPAGSARRPRTPPRTMPPPATVDRTAAATFGVLAIRVQPADADVTIDGAPWLVSGSGDPLMVHVAGGPHRVEIQKKGFKSYSTDTEVRAGETTAINVSLSPDASQ